MKAVIISSGEIKSNDFILNNLKGKNLVICADGGANHLVKQKIIPDIVIGDFDSISPDSVDFIKKNNIPIFKFPAKKDKTDTELAIDYAISKNIYDITLLGVTGSRLDHTMANIMLLYRMLKKGIKCKIVDENNEIHIIDSSITLERKEDTYVSIIPITGSIEGVSLEGFEYNGKSIRFDLGSTLGISNKINEDNGRINIDKGIALVIQSKD